MARGRDKSLAYTAAFGGADGDVLQIGIVAGQAACNRHGLCIRGVYAACVGADLLWQYVCIRGFELGQAAVLQNDVGQIVIRRQLFQHRFIGGNAP